MYELPWPEPKEKVMYSLTRKKKRVNVFRKS